MVHAFADCELDEELFQLRRKGKVVKIEPKVFDVLVYLLQHRDRVVSKDELLDGVWAGQVVSESVLPKCVAAARRLVGDGSSRQKIIQTVHGRGYRFVADVRALVSAPPADLPSAVGDTEDAAGSPFVGRERAMERLRQGLWAAAGGHGRVLLLVGEPGIGKTRTAEELAAEARRLQAIVLVGRSYEGEGAPAFWPWVQLIRACPQHFEPAVLAADMGAGAADIAELAPELRERVHGVPRAEALAGEQARFRLFDSITTFLKRAAARRPLVIVLDDLHWADEASLRLLQFLAGHVSDARILVLATYRDIEVNRSHPLAGVLGTLAREPVCERIALRGFEATETEQLVGVLMGTPPPPALAAAVQEMTDGNPFFIREMVRWLVSEGSAAPARQADASRLGLPQSVRDAIGRRLNRLSAPSNDLLRRAAVLGREFSVQLLAQLAQLPAARAIALLDEARIAGIVDEVESGLGNYAFHHALFRQTLYDELTTLERVHWHRQAGSVLEESCGGDLEPHLDELAHHFFQGAPGGDAVKAVELCVRAAERAFRLLAYEQSAWHYERALQAFDLTSRRDEADRCQLLLALGEAYTASGARARARAAFERAAEIARRLGRADLLAQSAVGYRGSTEMGSPPERTTLALLEEAAAQVSDAEPGARARVLSRLVGTPPYANSMETRDRLSREALALAERAGDRVARRDALSARLWACLGPDHIDERLAVATQLLEFADRHDDRYMALLAQEARLGAALLRGDMRAADHALSAYGRIAEELRQPAFLFQVTFWQGSRALARGCLDEAERLFRAALERGRGTVPYAHFMFAGQMYVLLYLRGGEDDPELRRTFFGEMMEVPYSWELAMRSALAFARVLGGESEAARHEFEALAARGFATIPRDEHWLVTIASLASVTVLLDDRRRAAELYELFLPYADLMVVHDLLRSVTESVSTSLGKLATTLGRYDDGVKHFETGIDKEAAMHNVAALIESKAGFARLLLRRGQRRDRARAHQLLREVGHDMAAHGLRRNWQLFALETLDGVQLPAELKPLKMELFRI